MGKTFQRKGIEPQGYDYELRVLSSLLDVVGHDGDVLEVQGGVDLVHDVEWGGFVVVEGKDESQGGQGLLATRQVADVLPRLLGGSHLQRWLSDDKSFNLKKQIAMVRSMIIYSTSYSIKILNYNTEKTMPSENGSKESTSSSSASPPSVIIWYISFSLPVIIPNLNYVSQ